MYIINSQSVYYDNDKTVTLIDGNKEVPFQLVEFLKKKNLIDSIPNEIYIWNTNDVLLYFLSGRSSYNSNKPLFKDNTLYIEPKINLDYDYLSDLDSLDLNSVKSSISSIGDSYCDSICSNDSDSSYENIENNNKYDIIDDIEFIDDNLSVISYSSDITN